MRFQRGDVVCIDQRVIENARSAHRVREISLGDYVLNGGEVAVMAMIEAIGRRGLLVNVARGWVVDEDEMIAAQRADTSDVERPRWTPLTTDLMEHNEYLATHRAS